MEGLKKTVLLILRFFQFSQKMVTEILFKNLFHLVCYWKKEYGKEKKRSLHSDVHSWNVTHQLALEMTSNVALHPVHNTAWLAVLGLKGQNS